jgi:DNA-binding response OmpR family regulator
MASILLADDDEELCELLMDYLDGEGFATSCVHDGRAALDAATGDDYEALILDVMMPGLNGFDVLRELRARSVSLPVLMLTARGEDVDRIVGLELGADDYLPKPFNPRELVARLRAILRRGALPTAMLHIGDVELRTGDRSVSCGGRPVELTGAEFSVLEVLLRAAGRVVAREALSEQALGRPLSRYDRSLDMHVSNLRKKLGPGPNGEPRIRAVRGQGYLYPHG